jgi:hypothetical protein
MKKVWNILKSIWNKKPSYRRTLGLNIRNGTKVAVNWLVFSGILIVWLLVGIPTLSIFHPNLTEYAPYLDKVIIALIGGASIAYSTSEIRKTVENIKSVNRPNPSDDAESLGKTD